MPYILTALTAIGFAATQYMIFWQAPIARGLYFNQKIFYYHVPCAFTIFACVFSLGFCSIKSLKSSDRKYTSWALASAQVGALFGALMLITGSLWGKAAWGIWWQWEARLTTSLLLWLLTVAYIIVRTYAGEGSEKISAVVGIFAMINVPLIYVSVKIWRKLHPQTTVVSSLDPAMKPAFWCSVLLFLIFAFLLIFIRSRQLNEAGELETLKNDLLDQGFSL